MNELGCTGGIEFPQFLTMMQRKVSQKVELEEQLKEAFKTLDKQNSGFLLVADLKHILTSIGEKMTKEEVRSMIQ